ncbi:MAG: hypothetical protein AB3X44_12805 [Leptothrix sp. (in: b-proteobacteria)]
MDENLSSNDKNIRIHTSSLRKIRFVSFFGFAILFGTIIGVLSFEIINMSSMIGYILALWVGMTVLIIVAIGMVIALFYTFIHGVPLNTSWINFIAGAAFGFWSVFLASKSHVYFHSIDGLVWLILCFAVVVFLIVALIESRSQRKI